MIDEVLLNLLVCPITGSLLAFDESSGLLINREGTIGFPIVNGVPVLIVSESVDLSSKSCNVEA